MPTLRLARVIIDFISKVKHRRPPSERTIKGLLGKAVRFYWHKHEQCFSCKFQIENIAGIELGKQKRVQACARKNVKQSLADKGLWVAFGTEEMKLAKRLSRVSGMSVRQIVEQAAVEHLTRPGKCAECPFYEEMCSRVKTRGVSDGTAQEFQGEGRSGPPGCENLEGEQDAVEASGKV